MIATFVLVAFALAFFSIGLGLPSRRLVSGTVAIAAPQERVYELVSDLETGWTQWSPLVMQGNGVALDYGAKTSGEGATIRWTGKAGGGSVELTAATPENGISYQSTMSLGGMTAVGTIAMIRDPSVTVVTWRDELCVSSNPVWKWLARAMDNLRRQNVARGLDALKRVAENGGQPE